MPAPTADPTPTDPTGPTDRTHPTDPTHTTSTTDQVLAREQAHLDHARAELRRMREDTDRLDAAKASDAYSSELLGRVLARRVASLQDDPRTTLFFGRIDTRTDHGAETFHIGRRHVSDDRGDPVVVDWRAPISTAFYRASPTAPMGVVLRRRFGVDRGRLTAYEDERLTAGDATEHSGILAAEIERPRSGPMRDIVSTIQPEQDEIVRSDIGTSICVQGAPGTGKTAVGLHRAAWLLYAFRAQLDRSGVLVVGPNRAFLDHIGAVLPSLGEVRVGHATIETLLAHGRVRAEDPTDVAILKGDARLAEVLHRAVWAHVGRADDALVVPRGSRRWRVPAYEIQDELDALVARGVRYAAARNLLPQRLAHHVLLQMERVRRLPRRPGAGHRGPVGTGHGLRPRALAGARPGRRALSRLLGCRDAHRRGGRHPHGRRAADAAVGQPASHEGCRAVEPGGPGAARRGGGPARPHAEPGTRGARRGAGPLPDAAAGRRPPRIDRVAHRARRHRPGHHAVGDRVVGRRHGAPGPSDARARRARPRLPRSGPGHRLRRPPAAAHGAGARRAECRYATTPVGSQSVATEPAGRAAAVDRRRAGRARPPRVGRRHRPGRRRSPRCVRTSPPPGSHHGRLDRRAR